MEQVWEVLYEYTCKIAILMTPHRLLQSDLPLQLQHADFQTRLNNDDELRGG